MNNPPSKFIKRLYKRFCEKNESIMIDLVAAAYKEGWNNCLEKVNECKMVKDLRKGGKDE